MASTEDPKGALTPKSDSLSENGVVSEPTVSYSQTTDDSYGHNDDPYSYAGVSEAGTLTMTPSAPTLPAKTGGGGGGKTPPPKPPDEEEDGEEGGMLRMSLLEHL